MCLVSVSVAGGRKQLSVAPGQAWRKGITCSHEKLQCDPAGKSPDLPRLETASLKRVLRGPLVRTVAKRRQRVCGRSHGTPRHLSQVEADVLNEHERHCRHRLRTAAPCRKVQVSGDGRLGASITSSLGCPLSAQRAIMNVEVPWSPASKV